MEVNNLKYAINSKFVRLSADIVSNNKSVNIYFEVKKEFSEYIYLDYSPFYAFTLMPAMIKGSNLNIIGDISKKLSKNNIKVQGLLSKWGNFSKINLEVKNIKDSSDPKYVACFFSLGVDSFYTFLKNKKGSNKKITHFILVHGFDVKLKDKTLFNKIEKNILEICRKEDIKLITVKTNLRDFSENYLSWDWEHGPALASIALLLRRKLKIVYMAGPHSKSQLMPLGLHPELDYLWSGDYMNIIHDGLAHTRLEKIKIYISKSSLALKYLRVCWKNVDGKYNCGKCNKCIRTMVDLKLCNVLDKARTFPPSLSLKRVRNVYSPNPDTIVFIEDSLNELERQKRFPDLQQALKYSLNISLHPSIKRGIIDRIGYFDREYNKKRLYFFLTRILKINL